LADASSVFAVGANLLLPELGIPSDFLCHPVFTNESWIPVRDPKKFESKTWMEKRT
jgi:hypothetical protein